MTSAKTVPFGTFGISRNETLKPLQFSCAAF